jgi:hypothetical protein
MIVPRVHRSVSWRHPYLVPAYAFVVSLLLATAVTVLSAPAEVAAVVPPPVVAPSPPPAPIEEFRAAKDGKPTLVVVANQQDGTPWPVDRIIVRRSGKDRQRYDSPSVKTITAGTYQELEESIVDRLVCIRAPAEFKVSVPEGITEQVTATELDDQRTSCQGGWSDSQTVPAELTFFVERKTG